MEDTRIGERVDSPLRCEGQRDTCLHRGDGNNDIQPRKGRYFPDCIVRHSRWVDLLVAFYYRRLVRMDTDTESQGQGCRSRRDQQTVFGSIDRNFRGKRHEYSEVLHVLTSNPVELTKDLADQIHVNARIATVKASAAKWAIRYALAAGAAIAVLSLVVGITNS